MNYVKPGFLSVLLSTSIMQATFIATNDDLYIKLAQHQKDQDTYSCSTVLCGTCCAMGLAGLGCYAGTCVGSILCCVDGIGLAYFIRRGGVDWVKQALLAKCSPHLLVPKDLVHLLQKVRMYNAQKISPVIQAKYGLKTYEFNNPDLQLIRGLIGNGIHTYQQVNWNYRPDQLVEDGQDPTSQLVQQAHTAVERFSDLAVLGAIRFKHTTSNDRCYDARCVKQQPIPGVQNDIPQLYGSSLPITFYLNNPTPAERTLFEQYYDFAQEAQLQQRMRKMKRD